MDFRKALLLLMLPVFNMNLSSSGLLTDPYEIMGRHYDAAGGLDAHNALKSFFRKDSMIYGGMEMTKESWSIIGHKKLDSVTSPMFSRINGDNGTIIWETDSNGKVIERSDDRSLNNRKLDKLMERYEYLNPGSKVFTMVLDRVEKIDNVDYYVVKITNTINQAVFYFFIGTQDFMKYKTVEFVNGLEKHTIFSDYREVGGIKVPFATRFEEKVTGQVVTYQTVEYEGNIDIDQAIFNPSEDKKDYEFVDGDSSEDISFEYMGGHIFINVNIGGKEFRWVLDSGAGASVIDINYAIEMGLDPDGELKAFGASKSVSYKFAEIPGFSVPGINFSSQKVIAIDVAGMFRQSGYGDIAGFLGYDFLSRFVTKIDIANKKISFYDPKKFSYNGPGKIIDAPLDKHFFTIEMSVDDKYSGKWHFDTGAYLHFYHSYAEANNFRNLKGVQSLSHGAGGAYMSKTIEFDKLEIAGFEIGKPLINFPLEADSHGLGTEGCIGLVGGFILKRFVTFLDYENQRIILEKGKDFEKKLSRDKAGLFMALNSNNEYKISYVSPDTPADKSGLATGDIILSVNGIETGKYESIFELEKVFDKEAGTEFDIRVSSGNEIKNVVLKLEDLY